MFYLGASVVVRKDPVTGAQATKQGPTRIERGRNAHASGTQLAVSMQWNFAWNRVEAEGFASRLGRNVEDTKCRLRFLGDRANNDV